MHDCESKVRGDPITHKNSAQVRRKLGLWCSGDVKGRTVNKSFADPKFVDVLRRLGWEQNLVAEVCEPVGAEEAVHHDKRRELE